MLENLSAVGRAREERTLNRTLCTKTIYNYIDLGMMRVKNFHLPIKLKRKAKGNVILKNKKVLGNSISIRPNYINNRKAFVQWKTDTAIGSKTKKYEILLTILEQKDLQYSGKENFRIEFSMVFKTITYNDSAQFFDSFVLEIIGTKIYFNHLYSSFERGIKERHNGILRIYITKVAKR